MPDQKNFFIIFQKIISDGFRVRFGLGLRSESSFFGLHAFYTQLFAVECAVILALLGYLRY